MTPSEKARSTLHSLAALTKPVPGELPGRLEYIKLHSTPVMLAGGAEVYGYRISHAVQLEVLRMFVPSNTARITAMTAALAAEDSQAAAGLFEALTAFDKGVVPPGMPEAEILRQQFLAEVAAAGENCVGCQLRTIREKYNEAFKTLWTKYHSTSPASASPAPSIAGGSTPLSPSTPPSS
jgi:hypothetical protein